MQATFNIKVEVVRPNHETTKLVGWNYSKGEWQSTLVPPKHDSDFDFSGEFVQEFPAAPAGPDTCWYVGSAYSPAVKVTNVPGLFWTVLLGNVYGNDGVGYGPNEVLFYLLNSPPYTRLKKVGSCGTQVGQQMGIHAPPDPPKTYTTYGDTNTGNVNALGASMTETTVTSIRSGISSPPHKWPK